MARELFVYWKVGRDQAEAARAAAAEHVRALRLAHTDLQAQLMRRADDTSTLVTFMETYSAPPAGVTPAVQAAIEAQARLSFLALGHPARHVEVFESLGT